MRQKTKIGVYHKIIGLIIALSFFAPASAKFVHLLNHKEHVVCKGENTTHFHALDIDCDFFKTKVHNQFLWKIDDFKTLAQQYYVPYFNNYSPSLYNVSVKHISLRAPPVFS